MDPSYSHAYPSSHRRSTSKISLPRRRSFIFTKEAIKSEPFLLLVASNVIAAYSTIAADAWSLKRGVSPVVLIAGGLSMGAIWGAVRGRGRFDLVGDLWPTLLLYAGLHAAQYFAFFVALGGLSPLRVTLFTASLALWKTAVATPRSSIPGTLSLVLATSISVFTSSSSAGSLTSSIFTHLAIFTYLLLGNLKDSPERKLVTQFAGTGNGLDTARTLAMAIGGFALSFVVLGGLLIGCFDSSFHAFATVEGLHHFSYATLLTQAIIAHPTVLLVPSTVKPTSAKLAYPTSIAIAMIVGMAFWRLEVESWDVAIAGIVWFSIVSLPVSPPNSNLLYPSHPASSIATAPTPSSSTHRLLRTYLKTILANPESKKIWYFLLLNLAYMLVQMIWGVWTNSLGLISDAIHMFFDCMALGVGLFASVMATWKPNDEFTYGYGRVETLSGFANGVFLILISVFIVFEAVQRIVDPPDMNTDQLLLVSSIGLAINLFGLFATGGHHHHGHSHGHDHGHSHAPAPKPKPVAVKVHSPPKKAVVASSHSHSHEKHDHSSHSHSHDDHSHDDHDHAAHSHAPDDKKKAHSHDDHDRSSHDHAEHDHSSHSHGDHDHSHSEKKHDDHAGHSHSHDDHDHSGHAHGHSSEDCEGGHDHDHDDHDHAGHDHSGHDHAGHNMHGVFLHVLADVLGSVGVIISTVLINWTGWTGWDPIASLLIATLIVASVVPLVIDSGKVLCLDAGADMEKDVRAALSELSQIKGLASYGAPRFWPKDGSCYVGSIHIHLLPATASSSSSSNTHADPGRPSEAVQQGYQHAKTYSNVEEVVGKVKKLLKSKIRGLSELNVQVEPSREGGGGMGGKGFCSCLT
ncbi:cation efflux family-domain-containing protein [Mrakia frigida]|uniref:cation diffusion facilitator family transporter n=1 Tax=Mrakia frigida TaxID=29902 RepID=UPI003FCC1E58